MKPGFPTSIAFAAALMLTGCVDDTGDDAQGQLLKEHQRALERARAVEDEVAEAARAQRQHIDESTDDG